jgi:hypothetical protein
MDTTPVDDDLGGSESYNDANEMNEMNELNELNEHENYSDNEDQPDIADGDDEDMKTVEMDIEVAEQMAHLELEKEREYDASNSVNQSTDYDIDELPTDRKQEESIQSARETESIDDAISVQNTLVSMIYNIF